MASPSCPALVEAIGAVLEDPLFSTTSPVAVDALQSAKVLQDWCVSENNTVVVSFTAKLFTDLEGALILPSGRHQFNKDNILQQYFCIRSSKAFISRWTKFLGQANASPAPTLYQHLTDIIYRKLLKEKYVIPSTPSSISEDISVTEGNALRYAAGYVLRQVSNKIKRSSYESKDDMDDCIKKLVLCDKESEEDTADDWIKLVDRGGLWHVRVPPFRFYLHSKRMRQYLAQLVSVAATPDLRSKFFAKVIMDEDIRFYWSIALLQPLMLKMLKFMKIF